MAIHINDVEIPNSKITEINNDALNMEYKKARKHICINRLKFEPQDSRTVLKYLEYKGNIGFAKGDKTMIHLWVHHKKFINGKIFNTVEIIQYVLDTYEKYLTQEHTDELIEGRDVPWLVPKKPVPFLGDMPISIKDYKIKPNGNPIALIKYFKELRANSISYVPLRPQYLCGLSYTYQQFGDDSYTKVYRKEDFAKLSSMKNLLIMNHISGIPLEKVPPEDIRTWKFGPMAFDLHMMFYGYPYELDISEWNVEHISRIENAFCETNLHPNVSNLNFHNCYNAISAFSRSNITKSPKFGRLELSAGMFSSTPISDVSNIRSHSLEYILSMLPKNVPLSNCTIYITGRMKYYKDISYVNCKIIIPYSNVDTFLANCEKTIFINCDLINHDGSKKLSYNQLV